MSTSQPEVRTHGHNDPAYMVKTLELTTDDALCNAWKVAFVDYGMNATEAQLLAMFKRRGYASALSVGAFIEDKIISLTLNGIGMYNGELTGYDTSTGTMQEYRRKGVATRLFGHVLPLLRQRNVKSYVLEVLKGNEAAKNLYLKMGFTVVREFYFFRQSVMCVQQGATAEVPDITVQDIEHLPARDVLKSMWDFKPSWQNSYESVQRSLETLRFVGAYRHTTLIGYGIVEPNTGDIPQLAVHPEYRRRGVGTLLLSHLLTHITSDVVKVTNVDITCESMVLFLAARGIENAGGQYEMHLLL